MKIEEDYLEDNATRSEWFARLRSASAWQAAEYDESQ